MSKYQPYYYSTPNDDCGGSPGDFSTLIGFLIGIVICAVISIFHLFTMTSCSRKVTEHIEYQDTTSVSATTQTTYQSAENSTITTTSLLQILEETDAEWQATFIRTSYTLPDSLGNQYVTQRDSASVKGSKHTNTTTNNADSTNVSNTQSTSVSSYQSLDMHSSHNYTADKQTDTISWYEKYAFYLSLFMITAFVFLISFMIIKYIKDNSST